MTEFAAALEQPQFATERDPRLRLIIPIIVAIAFLMEQLDSTIITTAIPAIAHSLDTTPVRLNLAITTYILTLAVFIPVSGWFADRFGARKVFALALFTFTLGSALCGVANSFGMLLAMRALQGLGGAMMTPVGRLILLRSFPRSGLITAMTYMTLPAIMGPVIGPLLGGLLTTYASWRWIFYVNVPFGCLGILAALRFVDDFHEEAVQRFDFAGFLMVGCGVALLQFGLENIGRPIIPVSATVLVLAASVLLLLAFGRYARRVAAPAVDLTLFRFRSFWVGTLAGGLCRVGLNGVPFLLPLMLQLGFGMSPVTSGSLTFVGSFGALLMRPLLSPLLRRFGFSAVLIGSAVVGSATVAERPMKRTCGACLRTRASASDSRWPRLEVTSECSSSSTTYFRSRKKRSASLLASSSDTCSGVVRRRSGGLTFWRWRFACGVSPVRVSIKIGRPISVTGLVRLRSISTASALSGEM